LLGEQNFIYAIIVVTLLVGLTGAPPLVLMAFLSFGMMKSANLPRYIAMAAVAGASTISFTSIPGTLGAGNVVATQFLGTNIYAGVAIGIVASIAGVILVCIYINRLIKKARHDGVGYESMPIDAQGETRSDSELPSFLCAIIPVFFLLSFCFVGILMLGMQSLQATVVATAGGVLLMYILNRKHMKRKFFDVLRESVNSIQWNIVGAIAVFGFAMVVTNTAFYQKVLSGLTNLSIHPYVLVVFGTIVVAALCADNIGGVAAFLGGIGVKLMESGVNVQVIHRLTNIASGTLDSLPHGGSMILALAMFGYDHKKGYKYLFVVTVMIPLAYTAVALVFALIFY
jgi:H+/gluconate symporter-like permease